MKSTKITIAQTADILNNSDNIAIFAHTRPDGDALGASVALYTALHSLGKKATIFCDTPLHGALLNFFGDFNIQQVISEKYDLMIAVDCGDLGRVGEFANTFSRHINTMTIDHHGGQYYSHCNCIMPYASTCQIIYELLPFLNVPLTQSIATCLYLGLITDTGNFTHPNTDKQCFDMASTLVDYDVPITELSRAFFKTTTLKTAKLQGLALSRVRMFYDNTVALVYADKEDYDRLNVTIDNTEGMVQGAINIDSVQIAISLCYYTTNTYKVSMRSKSYNVRNICNAFGGGGHNLASGCMVSGFLEDVIEKIIRQVGFEIC